MKNVRHSLHDRNTSGMQLVHHVFWWDTHSAYKQGSLVSDDHIRKFGQLAFGIVVLVRERQR